MNFLSRASLLPLALAGAAFLHGEPLDAILTRMDAAARQFHSFSARMTRTDLTAVLNDSEVMNGTIRMRKDKSGVTGVMEFSEPNAHMIAITGHNVQIFHPKANVVEIYDTAKYTNVMDAYLLLGFGTTAAELSKAYEMKAAGTETVGGVSTTKIELTPKSPKALELVRKIELWIPEGQSNPVQEKITKSSNDTILVRYSDLKVNPDLPVSAFELKLPADVRKLTPKK